MELLNPNDKSNTSNSTEFMIKKKNCNLIENTNSYKYYCCLECAAPMHAIAALDTTLLPSTSCCDDITNRFKNALDNSTLLCLAKNQKQCLLSHTAA
jgi:hypothetical protein